MTDTPSSMRNPSRRGLMTGGVAALGAAKLLAELIPSAHAATAKAAEPIIAPGTPPGGYNNIDSSASAPDKIAALLKTEPDFHDRCGIRSVFDGRYRFSRYFAPLDFNTPTSYGDLVANNDLELYDLRSDLEEVDNLALTPSVHTDLIMAMNTTLNQRLAEEVGDDDGSFLPIRDGKWYFPPKSER